MKSKYIVKDCSIFSILIPNIITENKIMSSFSMFKFYVYDT